MPQFRPPGQMALNAQHPFFPMGGRPQLQPQLTNEPAGTKLLGPKAEAEFNKLYQDNILNHKESPEARSQIFEVLKNESEDIQVWLLESYRNVQAVEKDAAGFMKDKLCNHKRAAAHGQTKLARLNDKYVPRLLQYLNLREIRTDLQALLMNMDDKAQKVCINTCIHRMIGYDKSSHTIKYLKVTEFIAKQVDKAKKRAKPDDAPESARKKQKTYRFNNIFSESPSYFFVRLDVLCLLKI